MRGTVFDVAVDLRSNSETYTLQGNRWNTWMKNIRNFRDKKYGWGENGSIVGVDLQGTAMEKQIATGNNIVLSFISLMARSRETAATNRP